jgi:hypothetical protein
MDSNENYEYRSKLITNKNISYVINNVKNFEEINFYLPCDLQNFVIFIDIDYTIIKPVFIFDIQENKYIWKEDEWICDTIQYYISQWRNKGAHIFFLTHRYFNDQSIKQIEKILKDNNIHLDVFINNLNPNFNKNNDNIFPIKSKLLDKEKNTTDFVTFSYCIRNIIFSRVNLQHENEARRLYKMQELETNDMEKIQIINPYLTNDKGETAKEIIEHYNNHCKNDNKTYKICHYDR